MSLTMFVRSLWTAPFSILPASCERILVVLLVCMCWGGISSSVRAAEDELPAWKERPQWQPLKSRIPAVSGRFAPKSLRFEVTPQLGLVLNDPFYKHLTMGGAVAFHLWESLSLGASAYYALPFATPIAISAGGERPKVDYNYVVYSALGEVTWAPIYGKLSAMAEGVARFDTFISLGGGIVGTKQSGQATQYTAAVGQRFFFTSSSALKVEFRYHSYAMSRRPVEIDETQQGGVHVGIGWSFFFPHIAVKAGGSSSMVPASLRSKSSQGGVK